MKCKSAFSAGLFANTFSFYDSIKTSQNIYQKTELYHLLLI